MPAARRQPVPDDIAAQAAAWIVRLSAGDAGACETARAGFEAWKRKDPRHAAAADSMQNVIGQLQSVREAAGGHAGPARAAFGATFAGDGKRRRTRRAVAAATLACALAVPGWLALQAYPLAWLAADMRSGTGQWETRTLSDGTRITLGSHSAVNLRFDPRRRALELVSGEILVDVAHDPGRPFLVETEHGTIRALGTRLVVDRRDDGTWLTMLESKVAVQAGGQRGDPAGAASAVIEAGQRVRIAAGGLGPVERIDARSVADAWKFHQLVVRDRPLPEVLDELNRYRRGRILYDRARLQDIDMAGVLPLDDTDRALQLLVDSVPALRVRMLTPYLVWVDAPAAAR
ncbi:FecR family protein [Cupriavidus sp. 30B13]|uniref:FecR family protein n=1 Tax=Cupriavidus sp. 30B13 TaxID=3384241 RepID=UPI003B907041